MKTVRERLLASSMICSAAMAAFAAAPAMAQDDSGEVSEIVVTGSRIPQPNLGPFRVSLPALDRFPLPLWARLVAKHAKRLTIAEMAYGDAAGHAPLRSAVADYLRTSPAVRGLRVVSGISFFAVSPFNRNG